MTRHDCIWGAALVVAAIAIPFMTANSAIVLIPIMVVVAALAGYRMRALGPALIGLGVGALANLAISALMAPDNSLSAWVTFVVLEVVAIMLWWWAGRYLRLRAEQRRLLQEIVAESARLRERTRIAQDVHDSLGHDLAMIALGSGGLELASDAPVALRRAAAEVRARAVAATDRLHEAVGLLQDESDPSADQNEEGADDLVRRARRAGMDVTIRRAGPGQHLEPAAVSMVVREGLTNAAKHASGASVAVVIDGSSDSVVVRITNGLPGAGQQVEHSDSRRDSIGQGLPGLHRRLHRLSGEMTAGPIADGYELVARIPKRAPGSRDDHRGSTVASGKQTRRATRVMQRRTALVPLLVVGLLIASFVVVQALTIATTSITSEEIDRIAVGDTRAQAAEYLPPTSIGEQGVPVQVPPRPSGSRCDFYLVRDGLFDFRARFYRLCSQDGEITASEVLQDVGAP